MLVKKESNNILMLENQKLISIKNSNLLLGVDNKQVLYKKSKQKKFYKVYDYNKLDLNEHSYTFLQKKKLIEKFEVNFGSLLMHEDITEMNIKQVPMFNIVMRGNKNLLASYDLQNIYINYFIRTTSSLKIADIAVDSVQALEGYKLLSKMNINHDGLYEFNNKFFVVQQGKAKCFLSKSEAIDFIQVLQRFNYSNVNFEGVELGKSVSIKEIRLFDQYTVFCVTEV